MINKHTFSKRHHVRLTSNTNCSSGGSSSIVVVYLVYSVVAQLLARRVLPGKLRHDEHLHAARSKS